MCEKIKFYYVLLLQLYSLGTRKFGIVIKWYIRHVVEGEVGLIIRIGKKILIMKRK